MSTSASLTIKTEEIVEVLTDSSLAPTPSPTEDIIPILTESTFLPPTRNDPFSPTELIERYDRTFPIREEYQKFSEQRLKPWSHTTDFKYFDHLYIDYRNNKNSAKNLRKMAQDLLEEAARFDQRAACLEDGLADHLSTMPHGGLRHQLYQPGKIHPKPQRVRFGPSTSSRPGPSRIIPSPYVQTNRPRRTEHIYRCFKCGDTGHFKQDCPHYQCHYCRKMGPGHWPKDCTSAPDSDYHGGQYDLDGYDDGNLNGEC